MIGVKDMTDLRAAIRRAATQVVWSGERDLAEALYPFWRDGIHDILLRRGCPCRQGQGKKCFLELEPHEQKKRFTGDLSLDSFVNLFTMARNSLFVT